MGRRAGDFHAGQRRGLRRVARPSATASKPIIWILGGDRPIENDTHREIIRAMARGLRKGDGGAHLITFHPTGGAGFGAVVPQRRLAGLQHAPERPRGGFRRPVRDDAHRLRPDARSSRCSTANRFTRITRSRSMRKRIGHSHRRRRAAAALLGPVQRRVRPHLRPPLRLADVGTGRGSRSTIPLMPWYEAIDQPGAGQMRYRPAAARVAPVPDPHSRRFGHRCRHACPPPCRARADSVSSPRATQQGRTRWFMRPSAAPSKCGWTRSRARRSRPGGSTRATARRPPSASSRTPGEREFTPPDNGEQLDWVLVLDDATLNYPAPGSRK